MNKNIEDEEKLYRSLSIKSFVIGVISLLTLIWLVSSALGEDFLTVLLVVTGLYVAWSVCRIILTSITFNLFLKSDLVRLNLSLLKQSNFPAPSDYEVEHPEDYLATLASEENNYPINVHAATMLNEYSHARRQGKILGLLRFNKVMRTALYKYRNQHSRE